MQSEFSEIYSDFRQTKEKKVKKWFWKYSFCCLNVKGGKRHMKIFISLWEGHKGLGYKDLLLF